MPEDATGLDHAAIGNLHSCLFRCLATGFIEVIALRVQVRDYWVLGFWVIVVVVQDLGKYMIVWYLDRWGCCRQKFHASEAHGIARQGRSN